LSESKSVDRTARAQEKRRIHNRVIRGKTRTMLRSARQSIAAGDADQARDAAAAAIASLDSAGTKRVFHKNKVARLKSRLSKQVNALETKGDVE
jgi:small subunit ribosomal protein S20